MDEVVEIHENLVMYKIKLTSKLEDFKAGEMLEAILLPIRIQGTVDDWESHWFVYNGEKLVTKLKKKDICFEVYFSKKKGKGLDGKGKK